MTAQFEMRRATHEDVASLRDMHRASLTSLSAADYSRDQIDGFLCDVITVDPVLVDDGTYYLIEFEGRPIASGGWTMRRPSFGNNVQPLAGPQLSGNRATIRAVFTAPGFTRRGLARRIMTHCEEEAVMHGLADRIELYATLTGLSLYRALGYAAEGAMSLPLSNGAVFPSVFMTKQTWPLPAVLPHCDQVSNSAA